MNRFSWVTAGMKCTWHRHQHKKTLPLPSPPVGSRRVHSNKKIMFGEMKKIPLVKECIYVYLVNILNYILLYKLKLLARLYGLLKLCIAKNAMWFTIWLDYILLNFLSVLVRYISWCFELSRVCRSTWFEQNTFKVLPQRLLL